MPARILFPLFADPEPEQSHTTDFSKWAPAKGGAATINFDSSARLLWPSDLAQVLSDSRN